MALQHNSRKDVPGGTYAPWLFFGLRATDYDIGFQVEQVVPFESPPTIDERGMWDAGQPTRCTITRADKYLLMASYTVPVLEHTDASAIIKLNGSSEAVREDHVAGGGGAGTPDRIVLTPATICSLVVGDYLELFVYIGQLSGVTIDAGSHSSWLMVVRIG